MQICKIVTCFEERYGTFFCDIDNPSAENIRREMTKGDSMLSTICKVLNTKVWPDNELLVNEDALQKQLESISFIYQHYHAMPIFANCKVEDIKIGFFVFNKICSNLFFQTSNGTIDSGKIFLKFLTMQTNICGKKTLLLIEIALCAPQSNAALERFLASSNMSKVIFVQVYCYKV